MREKPLRYRICRRRDYVASTIGQGDLKGDGFYAISFLYYKIGSKQRAGLILYNVRRVI